MRRYIINLIHTIKTFHNNFFNQQCHPGLLISQHLKIRKNFDEILISRNGHWIKVENDIEFTNICVEKFKEYNILLDRRVNNENFDTLNKKFNFATGKFVPEEG